MTEYRTTEPETITAGDLVQWKRESGSFSLPTGEVPAASAGWALSYALVKTGKLIEIAAAAHETDHYLVTLTAAASAAYPPGSYRWQAYLTKSATSERYQVGAGALEVLPNFAASSKGLDGRSSWRRIKEALEAKIENRATREQEEMVVGGQVVGMMPIHRLLEFLDYAKSEVVKEEQAERIANGLGAGRNVYVRFRDV